ncbi:MAG: hypothetical protein EPO00_02185 [Chloroflexota bacterium]|nr:MAG: hypothetical protein EPO00_02185 [Chloroflexota bacterium]
MARIPGTIAKLGLLAAVIAGCGDPRVTIWAANETDTDVYLKYAESVGTSVFLIPAGATGYVGSFAAPEDENRIEILSPDCARIGSSLDAPRAGGIFVLVEADSNTLKATSIPSSFDDASFEQLSACGATRP